MKRNRFLTIVLVLLLATSLVLGLVACVPNLDEPEYEDAGKIITNGNFALTTVGDYPRSPSSWSGTPGSTASGNSVETDEDALVSGVINVKDEYYKAYYRNWNKLASPGNTGQDDENVLMIYNKQSTSYGYRSNSMSLTANKYYKLTVDVRTDSIEGAGAYITLTGDTYKQFAVGSTNGQWKTYTFYFETSKISSNSVYLLLSNGYKGLNDNQLSKGYAFFDNCVVTELKTENNKSAQEQYEEISEGNDVIKASMLYGDNTMTNISGTSNPYTPAGYSNSYSSGNGGTAPTGSDYLDKGIINLNEGKPEFVNEALDAPTGSNGSIMYINNKQSTAFGYRNNSKLRFSKGDYYRIDILLNTFINSDTNAAGANIRLMTGTGTDTTVQSIEQINTNGQWTTYSFYIKADQMRNKDLYIEFSLGSGGKDDKEKLVQGQLYIDNFTISSIEESLYAEKFNSHDEKTEAVYSLDTSENAGTNIIENANELFNKAENSSVWAKDEIAYKKVSATGSASMYTGNLLSGNTGTWNEALWGANPLSYISDEESNVIMLQNATETINIQSLYANNSKLNNTDGYYNIGANKYYRIGMWVKTTDIKKTAGMNVSLMAYDTSSKDPNQKETDKHSTLQTISNFNTLNALESSSTSIGNNDYVELVFLVEGDLLVNKQIYLSFSMGSGTFLDVSSHVKGNAYISGLTMYEVPFSDYSSESGTYVKKHSFKSDSQTISNGDFNTVNNQTTYNYYKGDDDNYALDYSNGYLNNAFGVPSSWNNTSEAVLKSQLYAGTFNLNSTNLQNKINETHTGSPIDFTPSEFYKGFDSYYGSVMNNTSNPNVLAISTKPSSDDYRFTEATPLEACGCNNAKCIELGYCIAANCSSDCGIESGARCRHHSYTGRVAPFGFTSPSISLSANSYYMISVWAKLSSGTASIALTTTTKENPRNIVIDTPSVWTRYDFYIETGFDTTSATLGLYLGDKDSDTDISGTVFFDLPQLITVDEATFDAAVKKNEGAVNSTVSTLSYTINSFNNVTENTDKLDTPNNWTGAHADSEAPDEERDVVSGVYNYNTGNRSWFGKSADEEDISAETMSRILNGDNTNALVINNNVETEYAFTHSFSKTLDSQSYYRVSIKVLTYKLSADDYATITLKLNNLSYTFSNNESTTDGSKIHVNSDLAWKEYSFYIKTPNSASVTASMILGLGTEDNYMKGFAFFDDFAVSKIDEDVFYENIDVENSNEETPTYTTSDKIGIVFTDADAEANEPVEQDKNDPLLWLYISTGIIGGLVVLVALFYVGKKLYYSVIEPRLLIARSKRNKQRNKASYDKNNNPYTPNKDKKNDDNDDKFVE